MCSSIRLDDTFQYIGHECVDMTGQLEVLANSVCN